MVIEGASTMVKLYKGAYLLWRDVRGQDMIEYALMAASIVVVVAGFLPQTLMPSVSVIFSKLVSLYSQS
jgi:Flp pilus assembly pilin Flp